MKGCSSLPMNCGFSSEVGIDKFGKVITSQLTLLPFWESLSYHNKLLMIADCSSQIPIDATTLPPIFPAIPRCTMPDLTARPTKGKSRSISACHAHSGCCSVKPDSAPAARPRCRCLYFDRGLSCSHHRHRLRGHFPFMDQDPFQPEYFRTSFD